MSLSNVMHKAEAISTHIHDHPFALSPYRKALKAAIVLQPLLGITNSLQMMSAPYDRGLLYFAVWSYITTFLVAFQGFFAALFYCFLNGEVRR